MKIIIEPGFYKSFLESVGFQVPEDFRRIKNIIDENSCLSLEGVSVYLKMTGPEELSKKYQECPKSFVNVVYKSRSGKKNPDHYITTDLLTLYWCDWLEDLKYLSEPDFPHHEPRIKIQQYTEDAFNGVSKLKSPSNTYVAFLSDWIESENQDIIKELKNHGYIM